MKLINDHYSGKEAENYEENRRNLKWNFEQTFVENFILNNSITSVLDAPLGTNRFGNLIDRSNKIKKFIGYEFSDDMIKLAKKKKNKKIEIIKHDLLNETSQHFFDLILMLRMLNLVAEPDMEKILKNILPSATKFFICTLRYADNYRLIENKIYIHQFTKFITVLENYNFKVTIYPFNDGRPGQYSIILGEK